MFRDVMHIKIVLIWSINRNWYMQNNGGQTMVLKISANLILCVVLRKKSAVIRYFNRIRIENLVKSGVVFRFQRCRRSPDKQ